MNRIQEVSFKELKKIKVSTHGVKELENRKIQYDLLMLDDVLRAHVSKEGKATIIAMPCVSEKKILSLIPKRLKPKVLSREPMKYTELLESTFNA